MQGAVAKKLQMLMLGIICAVCMAMPGLSLAQPSVGLSQGQVSGTPPGVMMKAGDSVTYRFHYAFMPPGGSSICGVNASRSGFTIPRNSELGISVSVSPWIVTTSFAQYDVTVTADSGVGQFTMVRPAVSFDFNYGFFCTNLNATVGVVGGDVLVYTADAQRPVIAGIDRNDGSPTGAALVSFDVRPSELLTNFEASDLSLTTSGVSGAGITGFDMLNAESPDFGGMFVNAHPHSTGGNYLRLPAGGYFAEGIDYTIEGWVFPVSSDTWQRLLDFGNGPGSDNVLFAVSSGTTLRPSFHVYRGGAPQELISNTAIPLRQWTHLAVTHTGTTARIYINGNLAVEGPMQAPLNVNRTQNLLLKSNWAEDAVMRGSFDEFRIWHTARTQEQIREGMRGTLPTDAAGMLVYLRFDGMEDLVNGNGTNDFRNVVAGGGPWHAEVVGTLTPAFPSSVPKHYRVHAATGAGNGTIRLDANNAGYSDRFGNEVNTGYTAGAPYGIDKFGAVAMFPTPPAAANGALHLTVEFRDAVTNLRESVTGFTFQDLVAENCILTDFVAGHIVNFGPIIGEIFIPGAEPQSVFMVTVLPIPNQDLLATVTLPAGAVTDLAGNPNFESSWSTRFDLLRPTVEVTTDATEPTNENPITVTVAFSEPVGGFDMEDLAFTNATMEPGTFQGDGTSWQFGLRFEGDGEATLSINEGAAIDAAGNPSFASAVLTRTYDSAEPVVALTTTAGPFTNVRPIPVAGTITKKNLSDPLTLGDFEVIGGTAQDLVTTGGPNPNSLYFTLTVEPTAADPADEPVSIKVPAGAVADLASNPNPESNTLNWQYDTVPPTVVVTALDESPTNANTVRWQLAFSEPVAQLELGNLLIDDTNLTVAGFMANIVGPAADDEYVVSARPNNVNANGDLVLTPLRDGANGITDRAGNFIEPVESSTYVIDNFHRSSNVAALSPDGAPAGHALTGVAAPGHLGYAVSGLGDVNRDGIADIAVSAPGNGNGTAHLLRGTSGPMGPAVINATTAATTTVTGSNAGDRAGATITGVADFDGDGFADYIVASPFATRETNANQGEAVLIYGKGTLPAAIDLAASLNEPRTLIRGFSNANNFTAISASGIGDIDGDGLADIVIGAMGASLSKGEAYALYGRRDRPSEIDLRNLNGTNGFRILAGDGFGVANLGSSVVGAGDVNGDGLSDFLVMGNAHFDQSSGGTPVVFLIPGSATRPVIGTFNVHTNLTAVRFTGLNTHPTADAYSGSQIAAIGDFNGDGLADFAIGDPGNDHGASPNSGAVYVVYGANSPLGASPGGGEQNVLNLPGLATAAPDANGDGNPDGFMVVKPSLSFDDQTHNAYLGAVLASAGDFNGDGFFDLAMAAPGEFNKGGVVHVLLGRSPRPGVAGVLDLNTADLGLLNSFNLASANARFGFSVSHAGDVNSDGFADLTVGAPANGPDGDGAGAAYVIYGSGAGTSARYTAYMRSGNASGNLLPIPASDQFTGIGVVGDGSSNVPPSRVRMQFLGGTGQGVGGASRMDVTINRTPVPQPENWPTWTPAGVHWRIETDRQTNGGAGPDSQSTLIFNYHDHEVAGFDLSKTKIFHTTDLNPTSTSCWIPIGGFLDEATRSVRVVRAHAPGQMTNQIRGSYALIWANDVIDLGREIASPWDTPQCSRPGNLFPLNPVKIRNAAGVEVPGAFWHQGTQKLYAAQPFDPLVLEWIDSDARVVSRQVVRTRLPLEDSEYQFHVAETPDVDLRAPVPGAPADITFRSFQTLYREPGLTLDDAKLGQARFAATGAGRALIIFTTGLNINNDPIYFLRTKTVQWDNVNYLVDDQPIDIGEHIEPASHDFTLGSPWTFFPASDLNYFSELGYYNRDERTGPIIAVNVDDPAVTDDIVPVAFQRGGHLLDGTGEMLDTPAERASLSMQDHRWPFRAYRFRQSWPTAPPEIIIASGRGSSALDPAIYGLNFNVYVQNEAVPGFNPNEEHALIAPFGEGNALFALRNDLNTAATSEPYAMLNYTSLDGVARMAVWKVIRETPEFPFEYSGVAGTLILPVYPISFMGVARAADGVPGDSGVSGPHWSDKNGRFWARAAGDDGGATDIVMRWFYKNQPGFHFPHLAANAQPAVNTNIPLLDRRSGGTVGTPIDLVYHISWPAVVPELFLAETLVKQKRGLPNVTGQCSVDVIYEQSAANGDGPTVALIDPVRTSEASLEQLPVEIKVEDRGGVLAFTDLSPTLKERMRYDPSTEKLILKGIFVDRTAGEDYLLLNVLNQREVDALKALSNDATWLNAVNQLRRFPLPADSLSEVKGLSACYPNGQGYVTMAMQNATTPDACRDAPISLEIIKVVCPLYNGELVVIPPDCVFDERMTLRHTADLASFADAFAFEWWTHPDEGGVEPDPDSPLWRQYTPRPADGSGANELILGEGDSPIFVLSDNWFKSRYKARFVEPCAQQFSNFTPGQLAPGWIKRVLNQIDPFQQRFIGGGLDSAENRFLAFKNNQINTTVSMIGQAGTPWAGNIPLNCNNIDAFGLIEIYETVLNRARTLSVDATPQVDNPTVNTALLLVSGRLADLYVLLGNEAYADASDPTIGFSTNDAGYPQYGNQATSLHAFMNQTASLLEEELTLLRGRAAGPAPGTRVFPVFNRLFWNFTSDIVGGEVAYALNYNIQDAIGNVDGEINAEDAARLYPMGHGDAWGHYLTAMASYYKLLNTPSYTWVPRAEAVLVAGQPVTVDFMDERKFAVAAAGKARTGAEIVNLTFRNDYSDDPDKRWKGYKDADPDRAWGLSEWGSRAGQATYFDWVTANAIIPSVDTNPNNTLPIQKIDRTTVREIAEIAAAFSTIQAEVGKADSGLNPLGLAPGVVPFDIDPTAIDSGKTHFDQIYERALASASNAVLAFNNATASTQLLRRQSDSLLEFQKNVTNQEADFNNRLVEIFGRPYPQDVGPGGGYPSGYNGPDLLHWMYVDRGDYDADRGGQPESNFELEYTTQGTGADGAVTTGDPVTAQINIAKNARRIIKPSNWTTRNEPGELQIALMDLVAAEYAFRRNLDNYQGVAAQLEIEVRYNEIAHGIRREQVTIRDDARGVRIGLDVGIEAAKAAAKAFQYFADFTDKGQEVALEYTPKSLIFGFSNGGDLTSPIRGTIKGVTSAISEGFKIAGNVAEVGADVMSAVKDNVAEGASIRIEDLDIKLEAKERLREIEVMLLNETTLRLEMFTLAAELEAQAVRVQSVLAAGNRILADRARFRLQSAGNIQDYRYKDMAFRIFRNDALQKYRAQYDLAARYIYLAAKAYDYETNLLPGTSASAGGEFLAQVVRARSIGTFLEGVPQTGGLTGDPGLADAMARMNANWQVLRTQLGFNNPTAEVNTFSLRNELFRIPDGAEFDADWRELLDRAITDNILAMPEFRRFAVPFSPTQATEPGFVFRFGTNVNFGQNFFGFPLGPGDSQYSSSAFATKLRAVSVTLENYNTSAMGATPRVYLLPVGADFMRTPLTAGRTTIREWRILDQVLPVPFPLSPSTLANDPDYTPIFDSLNGSFAQVRRIGDFRAYPEQSFELSNITTSSRLIGRSVWNSEWVLIIPAGTLLANRQVALDRFVNGTAGNGVTDIKLVLSTYSFTGNLKKSDQETHTITIEPAP